MKKERIENNKIKTKFFLILFLFLFILGSAFFLFSLEFIRDAIGLENGINWNIEIFLKISLIFIFSLLTSLLVYYISKKIYQKMPLIGTFDESSILLQRKYFLPRFRATKIIKVKGIPRNKLKRTQLTNDLISNASGDIISSLSQICDEVSFWIVKSQNKILILFTVSGWSWFNKEKAIKRAEQKILSLKAAFKNLYPSILFENGTIWETKILIDTINKCNFGIETKGIPTLKSNQTQIDRLINTFDSISSDCIFVVGINKIRKGREKKLKQLGLDQLELKELEQDFQDSKKFGQSKVGIYALTENEYEIHTILAAILSIWSGNHTFTTNKLGDCSKTEGFKRIKKLSPIKKLFLSNKSLSSLIQLPEKPFLAEDTGKPIFEIPTVSNDSKFNRVSLGNIIHNERILDEFSLSLSDFLFNTEIVGMIGRGKTYLTATIIEQILDFDIGCLIFDIKGEYAKLFINEANVIVYTIGEPAPIGINLFKIENENEAQNVLALISEMLTIAGIPFSPSMLNIFEAALQKIIKADEKDLESFMYCLYQSSVEYSRTMKTSYSRESIDAILNRLNFIFGSVNYDVFSVKNNTVDLEDLDKGYKIILDFSEYLRRGASTASLFLTCNFILHLLSKFASEKGITNTLRYLVILEEAMYLIPKRFNLDSTASLGYSEQNFIMGRSLGIGTISIYQLWDSVSSVVHANSLTKILFRGEDIEKIRESISLSEEQLNYLPFLQDRHFIIKSKKLSGPALLRTKNFIRKPLPEEEYYNLAKKKFVSKGLEYTRNPLSLMEIKRNVFNRNMKYDNRNFKLNIDDNNSSLKNSKTKVTKNFDFIEENLENWEYCITYCPIRLLYKERNSNWIRNEKCYKIHKKATSIANKLIENKNIDPIINIIKKNPNYIYNKIIEHHSYSQDDIENEIAAFCALEILLQKLLDLNLIEKNWKEKTQNKIKNDFLKQINQ